MPPRRVPSRLRLWFGLEVGVRALVIPLTVVLVWAVIIGVGSFGYMRLLRGEEEQAFVRYPAPSSNCGTEDLDASAHFGINGASDGLFVIQTRLPNVWCLLPRAFDLRLLDGDGKAVPVDVSGSNNRYGVAVGWPPGTRMQDFPSTTGFVWRNWCGAPLSPPLSLVFSSAIGELPPVRIARSDEAGQSAPAPPCTDPSSASTLLTPEGLGGYVVLDYEPGACDVTLLDVKPNVYSIGSAPSTNFETAVRSGGFVENLRSDACVFADLDDAALAAADGTVLDLDVHVATERHEDRFIIGPEWAYIAFDWTNWCGDPIEGPLEVSVWFEDQDQALTWALPLSSDAEGLVQTPLCEDPDAASRLAVTLS